MTLLVSAMIGIEIRRAHSEWSISAKLQEWVDAFGGSMGLNRVALRRALVDEGYLHRDRYGMTFVRSANSPSFGYEPSIRNVNLRDLVDALELERAECKQAIFKSKPGATEAP